MGNTKTRSDDFAGLASAAAASPPKEIDAAKPIWIFGAGGFGRSLGQALQTQGFEVAGFVEDPNLTSTALGLPVVNWATLQSMAPSAQVALGMLNHYAPFDKLVADAGSAGFEQMLMPWDTYATLEQELGWRYWLSGREALLENLSRIEKVGQSFADDESRKVLYRILSFRLGLDTSYSSFLSPERRYFNEFTITPGEYTYVDCGAYDGDTFAELLSEPGVDCPTAYLLEPDPLNFKALVQNVKSMKREAVCLPLAAAKEYSILSFSSGSGEGSSVTASGDIHIAAVALDQLLPNVDADIIKLDVEGSEADVLRGSRSIIERSRPVLMVSYYHNPQDLWELPELLFELCEDYSYLLRQHQYNTFDSVLYAIPRAR